MTDYKNFVGIRRRRPLFNEQTPLSDVPVEWLRYVEPKIARKGFKGCWIAYNNLDKRGIPMVAKRRQDGTRYKLPLARYVMSIFYEFSEDYYVRRTCAYQQCVNPNHLYFSPHWRTE